MIQRNGRLDSLSFIRSDEQLAGKRIHVCAGSSFEERLKQLSSHLDKEIQIEAVENTEVEDLIAKVAGGEINYTIADENVAKVNQIYYPQIDLSTKVSTSQNLAWALRKGADHLTKDINMWLINFQKSNKYKRIYRKYYKSERIGERIQSEYFSLKSGKISEYDEILREKAKIIGWDWRLLSALVYQESRF